MRANAVRRRWWQYGMRSLLVLVTILCLLFGWIAYENAQFGARKRLIDDLQRRGFRIKTKPVESAFWQFVAGEDAVVPTTVNLAYNPDGLYPSREDVAAVSRWTSVESLGLCGPHVTDDVVKRVARFPDLTRLSLIHTCVTKQGISCLADAPKLEHLEVNSMTPEDWTADYPDAVVTDDWLDEIVRIPNLSVLWLHSNNLTDAALQRLAARKDLTQLRLYANQITDRGVQHLAELENLQQLRLQSNRITDQSLAMLTKLTNLDRLLIPSATVSSAAVRDFLDAGRDLASFESMRHYVSDVVNAVDDVALISRARLQGKGLGPKPEDRHKRLRENKERVQVSWDDETKVLSIKGTEGNDEIYIQQDDPSGPPFIVVWDEALGKGNALWHGRYHGADCANVDQIKISTGGGDDIINLTALDDREKEPWSGLKNSANPIELDAGPGDDLIISSEFVDKLNGNIGRDEIHADPDDIVSGTDDDA